MKLVIQFFLMTLLAIGLQVDLGAQEMAQGPMVSMDFHEVDVDSVLHFLGEASGLTIVKDPTLTGTISITTFGKTSVGQAINILNSALSVKGFTLVKTGEVLKIVPLEGVSKTNVNVFKDYKMPANEPKDDTVVTKMISLQYAKAKDVVTALQPLVGRFGSAIAYERTNTVIITDASANIARLTDLLEDLDRQVTSLVTRSYKVQHAGLNKLKDLLKQITEQYEHELGHFAINSDERTRTLFVTTLLDNFDMVEKLIYQLDQGIPQVLIEMEVVRIPYRNIDVDIRHRLFESSKYAHDKKVMNEGDQIFNWRYSIDADADKMFSWYGLSEDKGKEEFTYKLNVLYGPEYFDVYALPMVTVAEGSQTEVSIGHENYFYRLAPMTLDFKIIPHLNEDETVTLEMFQHVRGDWLKTQDAYARLVVAKDQTVVLGGLNELRLPQDRQVASAYREDTHYVSNEFLIFLTPHIIWDPATFKKKIEKQAKEAALKAEKPDLNLLFPGGFMEFDLPKVSAMTKQKHPTQDDFVSPNPGVELKVDEGSHGPPTQSKSYKIWWKMQDFVQLPEELVDIKEAMSDRNFVDSEVRSRLRKDVVQFMENVRAEETLGMEPDVSLKTKVTPVPEKENYVLKETLYRRGISFYKKQQYKGAIREFAPIMSIDPNYKNVQRYMQLSQQRYKEQLSDLGERNNIEKAIKDKALKELTQTYTTMDQKIKQVSQAESMGAYTKSDKLFNYIGEPKDIPSDRIEKSLTDHLAGEILEVSAAQPLVVINLGSIQNVHPGMAFKVYRDQEFIGKVRVSDVGEHVSGAEVVSTKTPKTTFRFGDKVVQALVA